jgi:hypothetical protein
MTMIRIKEELLWLSLRRQSLLRPRRQRSRRILHQARPRPKSRLHRVLNQAHRRPANLERQRQRPLSRHHPRNQRNRLNHSLRLPAERVLYLPGQLVSTCQSLARPERPGREHRRGGPISSLISSLPLSLLPTRATDTTVHSQPCPSTIRSRVGISLPNSTR